MTTLLWIGLGGAGLVAYTLLYEFVRHRLRVWLARRWRRTLAADLREQGGALERFRFVHKQLVRLDLLGDLEVNRAILDRAAAAGVSVEEVRDRVEEYIDEIVPFFNLLSFYKIAYPLGRAVLSMTYDLVVDAEGLERVQRQPSPGASVVFVFNHRSNADFVIANTIFSKNVALSFAVGEWARVWPLDALFRSFGSYFVRRGHRDPLYHKVLERYVQLMTRGGLTQGVFIEGGLSRDGNLRPAKIGILSYLLGTTRDESFDRDILFVPVGIGYDRVVEDVRLVAEAKGSGERRGVLGRLGSLIVVSFNVVRLAALNFVRVLRRRWRRFGHAAIRFGEPVSGRSWLAAHPGLWELDRDDLAGRLKEFGALLIDAIGRAIPVTPVPLVALALDGPPATGRAELTSRVADLRARLEAAGARVMLSGGFERTPGIVDEGPVESRPEFEDVDEGLGRAVENDRIVDIGLDILRRRRIVRLGPDGVIEIDARRADLARYYANTVAHYLGGSRETRVERRE